MNGIRDVLEEDVPYKNCCKQPEMQQLEDRRSLILFGRPEMLAISLATSLVMRLHTSCGIKVDN